MAFARWPRHRSHSGRLDTRSSAGVPCSSFLPSWGWRCWRWAPGASRKPPRPLAPTHIFGPWHAVTGDVLVARLPAPGPCGSLNFSAFFIYVLSAPVFLSSGIWALVASSAGCSSGVVGSGGLGALSARLAGRLSQAHDTAGICLDARHGHRQSRR